jgi:hypothetical protein
MAEIWKSKRKGGEVFGVETTVLMGRGDKMVKVPEGEWKNELAKAPQFFAARLAFMTREHHRVRNFVVAELPRNQGQPLRPEKIALALGLPAAALPDILAELERNLFFLVRDDTGSVVWAFPVTAARTAHSVRFESGESIFAA